MTRTKILITAGSVLLILLIAMVIWWFINRDTPQQADDAADQTSESAQTEQELTQEQPTDDASSSVDEELLEEYDEELTDEEAEELNDPEQEFDFARRVDGEVMAMGEVDAPIVMVEFADYRCPFCAVFARESFPELKEKYIDTGLMRYEWRDMPVFGAEPGDESFDGAVAGRAAGQQGMVWEFQEAIFAAAPANGHVSLKPDEILEYAEQIGIPDMDRFKEDLENEVLIDQVNRDFQEGLSIGVTSVPIFIIGEVAVAGAQPLDLFEQVIEDELEKVQ